MTWSWSCSSAIFSQNFSILILLLFPTYYHLCVSFNSISFLSFNTLNFCLFFLSFYYNFSTFKIEKNSENLLQKVFLLEKRGKLFRLAFFHPSSCAHFSLVLNVYYLFTYLSFFCFVVFYLLLLRIFFMSFLIFYFIIKISSFLFCSV